MLSAVILLNDPADPDAIDKLADTLSVLVSGVAGGLVGDAIIVVPREAPAVANVAEATGAELVIQRGGNLYAAGAAQARRDWILCLEAGDVLAEGWIRTLDRFVGMAKPEVGVGRLHRPAPLRLRLLAWIESVTGARAVRPGDVVRRADVTGRSGRTGRLPVRMLNGRIDRT